MSSFPRLVSLVPKRFEDGAFSGIPRFDWELRRVFPALVSVNTRPAVRAWLRWLAWREPDTIVITGNETSLLVPESLRTIVMHHGCAQTHFDRDPDFRYALPRAMCRDQREMYRRPNRWYVALARWTAEQFSLHYSVPLARVLPSWVEPIARVRSKNRRPVVLGDFRSLNKGSAVLTELARCQDRFEFRALSCSYRTRKEAYAVADAYACLSLSEGGSFAFSDAEAAALPLVTTNVGNYLEYEAAHVIPWRQRDDTGLVLRTVERALSEPRGPSLFEEWTFEKWRSAWHELVEEVAGQRCAEPVHQPAFRRDAAARPSATFAE